MDIKKYLRLKYDYTNRNGVSCFGLYAMIMRDEFGESCDVGADKEVVKTPSVREAAANFVSFLTSDDFRHSEVSEPKDFDLVIMKMPRKKMDVYHCGIWYNGKILHSRGSGFKGQVWYEDKSQLKQYEMRFYRYDHSKRHPS